MHVGVVFEAWGPRHCGQVCMAEAKGRSVAVQVRSRCVRAFRCYCEDGKELNKLSLNGSVASSGKFLEFIYFFF